MTDQQLPELEEQSYKTSHTAVRKARRFALQGLYEWLMTEHHFYEIGTKSDLSGTHDIAARTRRENAMHTVHLGYYHTLMREIITQFDTLNAALMPYVDRPLNRLDKIEYAVLLIGAYELLYSKHIPYKVVIDEAIELNAYFGATDSYKLINAVLDKLAKKVQQNGQTKEDNNQGQAAFDALPDLG